MEPCDSKNGCLFVAPGSHALERMFQHDYPPNSEGSINKFYHGILVRYFLRGPFLYRYPLVYDYLSNLNCFNKSR